MVRRCWDVAGQAARDPVTADEAGAGVGGIVPALVDVSGRAGPVSASPRPVGC
jgi:hypothetical protein